MRTWFLACLALAGCSRSVQLTAGQRMELIEQLDKSTSFAKKCGLGNSEVLVRFVVSADGSIAEPVVTTGPKGSAEKTTCVLKLLQKAKLSPHDSSLTVRTQRLLPTARPSRTDKKQLAEADNLPHTHVQSVISAQRSALEGCYERQLTKKPGLKGNMTLFFLIGPDGTVSDVLVESLLQDADVEWCVLDVAYGFRFDKPHGGNYVEVVHPLEFKPKS